MDIKHHTSPQKLESYSFIWSGVRLVVAAVALFLGGIPPVFMIVPWGLFRATAFVLQLCWILSGVASGYLLYMWNQSGQKVFGGKRKHDVWAFLVMVVSGFNLGIAGLFGQNIGMSITRSRIVFVIVGVVYIVSALHLYNRYIAHGKKLF
jgi:hypothetical protein